MTDVTPRAFERHLQAAVDDGWSFATTAEVLADPGARRLALTFDDGVATVLTAALPVLRHDGVPATAFLVTGWADGGHFAGHDFVLDWAGVRALQDAGLTLGSHSVTHADFGRLSKDDAGRELGDSRRRLREMAGVEVEEFAIPFGQARHWTDEAGRLAADLGYRTVYAHSVSQRPPGTVARTFITRVDRPWHFRAALAGAFDDWNEWF
jgi:peptidoglycan/xylan/chitin deacetylase (PgdA/CDA1 family)